VMIALRRWLLGSFAATTALALCTRRSAGDGVVSQLHVAKNN
jgi:hypothetical protein